MASMLGFGRGLVGNTHNRQLESIQLCLPATKLNYQHFKLISVYSSLWMSLEARLKWSIQWTTQTHATPASLSSDPPCLRFCPYGAGPDNGNSGNPGSSNDGGGSGQHFASVPKPSAPSKEVQKLQVAFTSQGMVLQPERLRMLSIAPLCSWGEN